MLDIESLAIDPVAAEEGTWAKFMGGEFLIARLNTDKATQLRSKLVLENYQELNKGGEEADKLAEQIELQVLSTVVLLDWKNITSNGKPLKYTPEVGARYLADPRFRDLKQFIQNYSINRENFRERTEQEIVESVKDSAAS